MKKYQHYVKNKMNKSTGLSILFDNYYNIRNSDSLPHENELLVRYHKELMSFAAYGIGINNIHKFCMYIDPKFYNVKYSQISSNIRGCCHYYSKNKLADLKQLIGDYDTYVNNFIEQYESDKNSLKVTKAQINNLVDSLYNICNNHELGSYLDITAEQIEQKRKEYKEAMIKAIDDRNYGDIHKYSLEIEKLDNLDAYCQNEDVIALRNLCLHVLPGLRSYKANTK